jgi:hypothetical protein
MREIYNKNLEKFSKYTEEQWRHQDYKDELGMDEDEFFHPPICKDCGEELDECECDTPSGDRW